MTPEDDADATNPRAGRQGEEDAGGVRDVRADPAVPATRGAGEVRRARRRERRRRQPDLPETAAKTSCRGARVRSEDPPGSQAKQDSENYREKGKGKGEGKGEGKD